MAKDKSPSRQQQQQHQRTSSSSEKEDSGRSATKSPSPASKGNAAGGKQPPSRPGKNAAAAAAAAAAKKSKHRHHGAGRSSSLTRMLQSPLIKFGSYFAVTVLCGILGYYYHRYYIYLPSLVNTPSELPKVLSTDHYSVAKTPDEFWGTYDANPYFAMRTRSPESLVVGIMWYTQPKRGEVIMPKIRYDWILVSDGHP